MHPTKGQRNYCNFLITDLQRPMTVFWVFEHTDLVLRKSPSTCYELTNQIILWSKVLLEKLLFPKEKKVRILSNPKFRYRIQQSPILFLTPNHINLVQVLPYCLLNIPININKPSKLGFRQAFLSFSFINKNNVRISFPMQS
jgi:hypothetical protein